MPNHMPRQMNKGSDGTNAPAGARYARKRPYCLSAGPKASRSPQRREQGGHVLAERRQERLARGRELDENDIVRAIPSRAGGRYRSAAHDRLTAKEHLVIESIIP